MNRSLALVLIISAALVGWLSSAVGQQDPAIEVVEEVVPPTVVQGQPPEVDRPFDGDIPRRAARDFVPWIEAVVLQKTDVANRIYRVRKNAQETLDSANSLRIFRKFPKLDGVEISLIGGRTLGEQTGVLLFTSTTEHGPVAFKIYHYKFGKDRCIGKLEITDDWHEIERLYMTVDILQNPITLPL